MIYDMKAGEVWIGDLCYVLHDVWDEVYSKLVYDTEGKITLDDGREIVILYTKYGDGQYTTNEGDKISVDSGTIGCIHVADIKDKTYTQKDLYRLGVVYRFETDFECSSWNGELCFGPITIQTDDQEDYEYGENYHD